MTLDRVRAAIKRVADTPGESEYSADVCQTTVNAEWQLAVLDALQAIADEMAALSGEWYNCWRPFASAPTDGREILVYRPDAGVFAAVYHPAIGEEGEDNYCWFAATGEDLTGDLPTHWMPLPPGQDAGSLAAVSREVAAQPPEVQPDLPEWLQTINEVASGIRAYIGSTAGVPEHILSEWGTWLQEASEGAKDYVRSVALAMTKLEPTREEQRAIAALRAGYVPYQMSDGAWSVGPPGPQTNGIEEETPIAALAAAADALGIAVESSQVGDGAAQQTPMVQVPAPPPEALLFLRGEIKVWRDLAQAYAEEAEAAGSTLRRWMAQYYAWLADYAEAALSGQAPSQQETGEPRDRRE